MEETRIIADVILPLPLRGRFTYLVPANRRLFQGSRVIVQFGARKIYTAIVAAIREDIPAAGTKEILEVLDEGAILQGWQIDFFKWMADYYMCSQGEVVHAAVPAGLKLSSESFVVLNPGWEWEGVELTEREETVAHHLAENELSIQEIGQLLDLKHPQPVIKSLADKRVVSLHEKVKDRYQPKRMRMVRMAESFRSEEILEEAFKELEKKPKQLDVLLAYLREEPITSERGILKTVLTREVSTSSLNTLIKNGIMEEWDQPISRLPEIKEGEYALPELSYMQEHALKDIRKFFESKEVVLLRGVTGSGKTEIYIRLIQEVLDQGGRVLYLLPEIALTTQIIKRLQRVFGTQFGVYHSHYSDNERVEVWNKVLNGEYAFVVGVRSALFLPFPELDLVIVDEEHEPSYKQFDPAPRYHARDAAIYLARIRAAKTLLGSATPAIDTYYKALEGKFGLVELEDRFGEAQPPQIKLIDLKQANKRREMKGGIFAAEMLEAIGQSLSSQEQVILFQNRRGYAPFVSCEDCGHVMECPNCDVSLTYHQFQNQLTCHYCGHRVYMPQECPACGQNHMKHSGFGTEQLEDELQPFFPEAAIQRMDLDTTRNKMSYQNILNDFEDGRTDILVGTQMISKGLDFDRVNLVGIFDIDRILYFPDFRSHERAYQLITQVSGRAGRKSGKGVALIQTFNPNHEVLAHVQQQDYKGFYLSEITDRETYHYPPFYRIIRIILKHREAQIVKEASIEMARTLGLHLGERLNGPVDAMIPRIRNQYHKEIQIKAENGLNLASLKELIMVSREQIQAIKPFKQVRIVFDVDPV